MPATRESSSAIYRLKHAYGEHVRFFRRTEQVDTVTGDRTWVVTKLLDLKYCVPYSHMYDRYFIQDIAYLRAASNFTEGGLLDRKIEQFLVDQRDLNGVVFELDDYLDWDNERWDVKAVQKLKLGTGVIVTAQAVRGLPHRFAESALASDSLTLTDDGTWTL